MFYGHKKNINILNRHLKRGIGHAYLFSGPEYVGKKKLAEVFAKSIVLGKDKIDFETDTPVFDVVLLGPEIEEKKGITKTKDISISQIREVLHTLSLHPHAGCKKVLIIDDAHRMNTAAQNALLKTLEESNDTSILILVTHEEGKLLPTIHSRCQKFYFGLIAEEDASEMSATVFDADLSFFSGRPGLMKKIIENGTDWKKLLEVLGELQTVKTRSIIERMNLAEKLSQNAPQAIQLLEFMLAHLHHEAVQLRSIAAHETMKKIEETLFILKNSNANSRLALEHMLFSL